MHTWSTGRDNSPQFSQAQFLRDSLALSRVLELKISSVANYHLPDHLDEQFQLLRDRADSDPSLDRLRPNSNTGRDWHQVFTNAAFGDALEGCAAMEFYLEEVGGIETRLTEEAASAARKLRPHSRITGGAGNTRRLDFAYQSHVLAVRRTLEYFAGSVAAVFKQQNPQFRRLPRSLDRARPQQLRDQVVAALARHDSVRSRVLTEGSSRSVRDRISHWNSVPAGILNIMISPDEAVRVFVAGGGEELPGSILGESSLASTLRIAADEVIRMIFDVYDVILEPAPWSEDKRRASFHPST